VSSRVDHLRLQLRVPEAARERVDELRRVVERDLVVRVIEAIEEAVHARLGADAIVRIRHLPAQWRIEESELALPELAARLARDMVGLVLDRIDATPRPRRLRPRADADIVCFEDGAHAAAAELADLADGGAVAWFHPPASSVDAVWQDVVAGGTARVHAVLAWLERMDAVAAVLSATRDAVVAELVATLPAASWPQASRAVLDRRQGEAIASMRRQEPRGAGPSTGDRVAAGARAAAAQAAAAQAAAGGHGPAPAHGARLVDGAHAGPGRALRPGDAPDVELTSAAVELDDVAATAHAGLFYLIGRVLELDLAEHLWCAGVPEGDFLCHVAAAILGDAGEDPAWLCFGGALDHAPVVDGIAAWAVDETAEKIQHALGVRLVRFGVTTTPDALERDLTLLAADLTPAVAVDADAARLIARSAAAIVALACARLGEPPSVARVRALASRPGTIRIESDALRIVIAGGVDVDVRRAGLDQDPGFAPWLARKVQLVFAGMVEL
jgi:hypothetical protein